MLLRLVASVGPRVKTLTTLSGDGEFTTQHPALHLSFTRTGFGTLPPQHPPVTRDKYPDSKPKYHFSNRLTEWPQIC